MSATWVRMTTAGGSEEGRGLARGIVTRRGRDGSPARGGRRGRVEPAPSRDAPCRWHQGNVSQTIRSFEKNGRNVRKWFAARNQFIIIFGERFDA